MLFQFWYQGTSQKYLEKMDEIFQDLYLRHLHHSVVTLKAYVPQPYWNKKSKKSK